MRIGQSQKGDLLRLCLLSGHSSQAYYKQLRKGHNEKKAQKEVLILGQVMAIRSIQHRLGSRKLHHLLGPFMQQHEALLGRDRFHDLLKGHGLLVRKRRPVKPRTTNSAHRFRKHPDLRANLNPERPEELWVSDITYIPLQDRNVFLSLVTDAYSRKIVGYELRSDQTALGPLAALRMALAGRKSLKRPLIHHSDRGSQYCCDAHVALLQQNHIHISMTQSGDPRDNAIAERVNGTLKNELLGGVVFADMDLAKTAIDKAVYIYNYLRPHSSIGMHTPAVAHALTGPLKRCWKNYYSKREEVMDG